MATQTGSSPLDRMRAKRARRAAQTTRDFEVPGFDGELVVRYRILDPLTDGKEIGQRIQQQFGEADQEAEAIHFAQIDTLLAACVGFYAKEPDGQVPLGRLLDTPQEMAPTYADPELAEALGFEADSARDAVVAVFGGNRIAVNAHAVAVQTWMAGGLDGLNQGLLGG